MVYGSNNQSTGYGPGGYYLATYKGSGCYGLSMKNHFINNTPKVEVDGGNGVQGKEYFQYTAVTGVNSKLGSCEIKFRHYGLKSSSHHEPWYLLNIQIV